MIDGITLFGHEIVFLNPEYLQFQWLLAFFLVATSAFFIWRLVTRPQASLGSKYSKLNSFAFWSAVVLAASAFSVALARPVEMEGETAKRGAVDVIVAVDYSLSMRGDDLGADETRLSVAKREVLGLLQNKVIRRGDRASFFVFGKESFLSMPLTTDLNVFGESVESVAFSEGFLDDETVWGTNLPITLEHIYKVLDEQSEFGEKYGFDIASEGRPVVVFMFTDGDNEVDNEELFRESLREFSKREISAYPIGVGTREGVTWSSLLRGYTEGEDYLSEYVEGWEGQVSRLETELLSQIASATGGEMHTVTDVNQSAVEFMSDKINDNRGFTEVSVEDSESKTEYWYPIALSAVIILIIVFLFI